MFVYIHKHTYIGTHALRCACGESKETITSNPLLSQIGKNCYFKQEI